MDSDNLEIVKERYKIIKKIGEGGMGKVYHAYDMKLEREVALKFLMGSIGDREIKRLRRETRLMATMSHPNVVAVYDRVDNIKTPFIVMELIKGCSLSEFVQNNPMTIKSITVIMIKICRAISYIHKLGIIHRDLKLENIMIEHSGELKVMDFGLAKVVDSKSQLSSAGAIIGSVQYMSPEQAKGDNAQVDYRSDIYSLGVILYELLTRKKLFEGSSFNIIFHILNEQPTKPTKIKKRIPKDLEIICLKAIEKDKKNRYESASALIDDLELFQSSKPINAKNPQTIKQVANICYGLLAMFILIMAIYILAPAKTTLELMPLHKKYHAKDSSNIKLIYKINGDIRKIIFTKDVSLRTKSFQIEWVIVNDKLLPIKRDIPKNHFAFLHSNKLVIKSLINYGKNKFAVTIVNSNNKKISNTTVVYREQPQEIRTAAFRGDLELRGRYSSVDINKEPTVRKFHGAGNMSPIVVDDIVFYGSSDKLRALNVTTEKILWEFPLSYKKEPEVHCPCWAENFVFVGIDQFLCCLDAKSGKLQWRYQIDLNQETNRDKDFVARFPTVAKGIVFFSGGNHFYALDMYSKELLWCAKYPHRIKTQAAISLKNNMIYFCVGHNKSYLYGLDMRTGKQKFISKELGKVWWSSPVLHRQKIYFSSFKGDLYVVDILKNNVKKRSINNILRLDNTTKIRTSFAIDNYYQYLGLSNVGSLQAFDLDNEKQALWTHQLTKNINFKEMNLITSPIITDNNIYVAAYKSIYALQKNHSKPKILWSVETQDIILSTPVIQNGTLYCTSTDGYLYVLQRNN